LHLITNQTGESAMPRPAGAKTQAVRKALSDNPRKSPKEISELLKKQGVDATASYVSTIKSKMKGKGKRRKKAVAAAAAVAPVVPKDAVSVALLCKAKKLARELGGVQQAQAAIAALARLLD
jgi:hypothetical protein